MTDPLDALRLPIVAVTPAARFGERLRQRIAGERPAPAGSSGMARYFVTDLDAAISFYRDALGFGAVIRPAPDFAMLTRDRLQLLLSIPGPRHAMADGSLPAPGGSGRILIEVDDLEAAVGDLDRRGVPFRRRIEPGITVRQAVVEDPSGNFVELFERLGDARNADHADIKPP